MARILESGRIKRPKENLEVINTLHGRRKSVVVHWKKDNLIIHQHGWWVCNQIYISFYLSVFWTHFNCNKWVDLILIRRPSFNSRIGLFLWSYNLGLKLVWAFYSCFLKLGLATNLIRRGVLSRNSINRDVIPIISELNNI